MARPRCINGVDRITGKPCSIEAQALKLEKTAKAGPLTESQASIIRNPGAHVPYSPLDYDLRFDMNDDAMRERRGAAAIRNWPQFKEGGISGKALRNAKGSRRSL